MRSLFAQGAIGELVRRVQTGLSTARFYNKPCDGRFGKNTADAVTAFQKAKSIPQTATVDDTTWLLLCGDVIPVVSTRCLQLTASFENHGFGLALGNFDGALHTWGIIGFTLASGRIQKIVARLQASDPQRLEEAFGASLPELLDLLQAPKERQKQWANDHTVRSGQSAEPWRSMFAVFGSFPEVQGAQIALVRSDYLRPAITTCRTLGLCSELGLALAFDIHVQNGGAKPAAQEQIEANRHTDTSESELRGIIANAVADCAAAKWREDVRKRKLAIATAKGTVHGHTYVLDCWGLSDQFAAEEIASAQ